jgi:hypothetical protein
VVAQNRRTEIFPSQGQKGSPQSVSPDPLPPATSRQGPEMSASFPVHADGKILISINDLWVAEEAVHCEPFSAPDSLVSGKITGNFSEELSSWLTSNQENRLVFRHLRPLLRSCGLNRSREFKIQDQGSDSPGSGKEQVERKTAATDDAPAPCPRSGNDKRRIHTVTLGMMFLRPISVKTKPYRRAPDMHARPLLFRKRNGNVRMTNAGRRRLLLREWRDEAGLNERR